MIEAHNGSTQPPQQKCTTLFSSVSLTLLIALCFVYTWRPLQGVEDFWAHAAVGRWIWEHSAVPQQTLWLWSVTPIRWIAHSWLSELFFFALMKSAGAGGALFATAVLVALPFAALWRLWMQREGSALLAALFFLLAITCAAVRFQPRPELLSYFFLTFLLLYLVKRSARQETCELLTWKEALWLTGLFVLWANCHGGVALGLAFLLLTVLADGMQSRSWRRAMPTLAMLCCGVLAVNINPYGLAYWSALAPVGGDMFKLIDEWRSPLAQPALPPIAIGLVLLVVIIALLAWLGNRQRRWSQLAWLLFMVAFFFLARRNLWPLMLVATCVAAANAQSLCASRLLPHITMASRNRRLSQVTVTILLLVWVASSVAPDAQVLGQGVPKLRGVSPRAPLGAARFVKEHKLPSPLFNDYLRSGYLHWNFEGQPPLYIDLLNAYEGQLLHDYFEIIARTPRGRVLFEAKKIKTVVFGHWNEASRLVPLAKYLDASPQWRRAYSDANGVVWVRRSEVMNEPPTERTAQ